MHRLRVEEQHAAFQRLRGPAPKSRALSQIDVETGDSLGFQIESQRRTPFRELRGHPFDMPRRKVARVHELQQQHAQIFLFDRGEHAVRKRGDRDSFDLLGACPLEEGVEVPPTCRNPLFVSVEADFYVETLMHDLTSDQLCEKRLPLVALRAAGDIAAECLITQQESLRQIEQSLPDLAFNTTGPVAVLQILSRQSPS